MREPPAGALHGYDRRVVYADGATAMLYAALTTEGRAKARDMIEHDWMGTLKLTPADVPGLHIADAEIRISDCVASCRIVFARDRDRPVTEMDGRSFKTAERLPASVLATLKRRTVADLVGIEAMRTFEITDVRQRTDHVEISYCDRVTSYIIDPLALAPEADRRKRARA